jgi:hypothetical protein
VSSQDHQRRRNSKTRHVKYSSHGGLWACHLKWNRSGPYAESLYDVQAAAILFHGCLSHLHKVCTVLFRKRDRSPGLSACWHRRMQIAIPYGPGRERHRGRNGESHVGCSAMGCMTPTRSPTPICSHPGDNPSSAILVRPSSVKPLAKPVEEGRRVHVGVPSFRSRMIFVCLEHN